MKRHAKAGLDFKRQKRRDGDKQKRRDGDKQRRRVGDKQKRECRMQTQMFDGTDRILAVKTYRYAITEMKTRKSFVINYDLYIISF